MPHTAAIDNPAIPSRPPMSFAAPAWLDTLMLHIGRQGDGSAARRAAFVCWVCVPVYLLFSLWALGGWFLSVTDASLDGRVLSYATLYGFLMTALWVAAATWGTQLDHLHKPDATYTQLVLAGYAGSTAFTCYLVGTLNIISGLVMMGAPLLGILLFPLQRILMVFVVGTLLILGASVASALGWLPYAPVLNAGLTTATTPGLYYALSGIVGSALYVAYEVAIVAALVAAARRRQHHALTLATTDSLTRLANRSWILAELARQLAGRDQENPSLSIVLVDLDRFQQINEQHGHRVGDRALSIVAEALRHGLRNKDLIGRVHGEEFLAILPATRESDAREIAERLRLAVRQAVIEVGGKRLALTASVGVAACSDGDDTVDNILQRAQRATTRARLAGRDRVSAA